MIEVKTDLLKNRLYITFGRIFPNTIDDIIDKISKVAWDLRPGFTCITRITDIREPDEEEFIRITKIQDYLLSIGISKVVRVGYKVGTELLEKTSREVGYTSETASSIKEAERILDEFESDK